MKTLLTMFMLAFFTIGVLCAIASMVTLFTGPFLESIALMIVMAMCFTISGIIAEHS